MEPPPSPSPGWSPEAAAAMLRRETLESVLEQCQRALEILRDADLGVSVPEEAAGAPPGSKDDGGGDAAEQPPPPEAEGDYETDELCDLLKSRVESPEFLKKLGNIQESVYQNGGDEATSWDLISGTDLWDDKCISANDESEDGYVLVKQEDVADGIACFMATYLLSLKQTKDLTPDQLQQALGKTFSTKKRKNKLQKAWDGTKLIYNLASCSATAVGIYQNPAIVKAATAAFWTSHRVISKFL